MFLLEDILSLGKTLIYGLYDFHGYKASQKDLR